MSANIFAIKWLYACKGNICFELFVHDIVISDVEDERVPLSWDGSAINSPKVRGPLISQVDL